MFAEVDDDHEDEQQTVSTAATEQVKLWETIVGLRISLQRSLEAGNKLPGSEFLSHLANGDTQSEQQLFQVKDGLKGLLGDLNHLLDVQAKDSSSAKKRKVNEDLNWEDIVRTQQKFRPSWESTVNKWHARLHFGSEQVKSKMKVFNQTIWEQIEVALEDDNRVIEKSRTSWEDSKRIDKGFTGGGVGSRFESESNASTTGEDGDETNTNKNSKNNSRTYDPECYDDRPFYSMLLKTFITSASGASASQGGQGMSSEDLEALRKFKRSKVNVDRKASKGRKIRYTRHPKLENFMFPVARIATASAFRSDGDGVGGDGTGMKRGESASSNFFQSLFQ